MIDRYDVLAVSGVLCLTGAIAWGVGPELALAFVGVVLMAVGVAGAGKRG